MTYKSLATSFRTYLVVGILSIAVAWIFRGTSGAAGMALGLGGAGFSICALWYLITLIGKTPPDTVRAKTTSALIVLAFFAKLPFYMIVGMLAHRIGGGADTCFLLGVGLVYFALVGWALAQG